MDKSLTASETCFPEKCNCSRTSWNIFCQQLWHIIKYGGPNNFYFLYGLDIKGFHIASDYVDYSEFVKRRDYLNRIYPDSSVAILRNKFLFGLIARALKITTPRDIGIIEDGKLYLFDKSIHVSLEEYVETNQADVFIKSINGECADGVYHLEFDYGVIKINGVLCNFEDLQVMTANKKFILQEKIYQAKALAVLHPYSINTIRLETVYNYKEKRIEILPPLLRVGTNKNKVDNWAVGGFAIGIDVEKKCLRKYGFYKPAYGTKAVRHPDTGILFEGYPIPFLEEAIEAAKRFHSYLTDVHSIGWDIAITDEGPCFVEGNDNWEISLVQVCSHGLMDDFKRLFY